MTCTQLEVRVAPIFFVFVIMSAYDPSDPYRLLNKNCAGETVSQHFDRIYDRILHLKHVDEEHGLAEDDEEELRTLLWYASDICQCNGYRGRCRWCHMLRPEPETHPEEASDPEILPE